MKENIDFASKLQELEQIVKTLENAECSLEESIGLYEKGLELSKDCSKVLENARQRIIMLSENKEENISND